MRILCVGVNHQSAPLELRSRLAFDAAATARALAILRTRFDTAEFVILSTCNRVELYCAAAADAPPEADDLLAALADFHRLPLAEITPRAYRLETPDAVRHLLDVAVSLDSMVVGEGQILGQVKQAFVWAVEAEATGKFLNRLFHRAFHTAKRVRAATDLGRRRIGVASVAVDYASRTLADLSESRALVVGSGEMAERIAMGLHARDCTKLVISGRTASRAADLAAMIGAEHAPWEALDEALAESDLVISATSSPEPVLLADRMAAAQQRRSRRPWLVIDVAVPPDVEPSVGELPGVHLADLDALGRAIGEQQAWRQRELDLAAEIVADETRAYLDWFEVRDVGPLVDRLEAHLHALGDAEVDRLLARLGDELGERERSEIRLATHRIVHKLLHDPIARLKSEAREGQAHMSIRALRRLFGLDGDGDDEA